MNATGMPMSVTQQAMKITIAASSPTTPTANDFIGRDAASTRSVSIRRDASARSTEPNTKSIAE